MSSSVRVQCLEEGTLQRLVHTFPVHGIYVAGRNTVTGKVTRRLKTRCTHHHIGWNLEKFPHRRCTLVSELLFYLYFSSQMLCCLVYIIPAYAITGQPFELMRFGYFTVFLIATSLTSQSTGFLCGAVMPVKVCFPEYLSLSPYLSLNLSKFKSKTMLFETIFVLCKIRTVGISEVANQSIFLEIIGLIVIIINFAVIGRSRNK